MPRRYRYVIADVFTTQAFGGNPLAVVTDGRGLSSEEMQKIAREFNLSETVIVLPPEEEAHFRKLRIFTPAVELPFAGHPTVGTACMLALLGQAPLVDGTGRIVVEEGVGPVAIEIRAGREGPPWARFTLEREPEQVVAALPAERVAAMLSLDSEAFAGSRYFFGTAGMRFLYIELPSAEAVSRVRLRHDLWDQLLHGAWTADLFVYARMPGSGAADLHARMFAHDLGLFEDPATGAACAGLGGCLAAQDGAADKSFRWRVEQGVEMGRPSLIEVEAEKRAGRVTQIRVGGHAVLVGEGTLIL
jgi:trans-2,3-dihydro-3-hydroxyanthranilate isomerase